MINCRKCGVELTDANWAQGNSKSYNNICKTCHNIQNRTWVKANPEKARNHSRIGAENIVVRTVYYR